MKTVLQSLLNVSVTCVFLAIVNLTQCANIFAELDMVAYCTDQRSLCQNTGSFIHIVCEYYGKIGSSCSMFSDVPLDDSHENTILQRINSPDNLQVANARMRHVGHVDQKLFEVAFRRYLVLRIENPRVSDPELNKKTLKYLELEHIVNNNIPQLLHKAIYSQAKQSLCFGMRAQAAHGTTIGKGQLKLPRAYGLKKVFWDSELAAFAKIMINQCITRHRYSCAASKNFASPMMVYAFANTTSSAAAIIDNVFASWEADALATTPEDILHSPDLKGGDPRPYINMVVGDVTHVGCAAGIYEHEIRPIAIQANDNIRLSGHIICYLSHYSREGTPVYNTTAPIPGTWWTKCGCPPMYRETRDCLCVPIPPSEHMMKQPRAVLFTEESRSTITTSTQVYYNDLEKYMQNIYNIDLPQLKGPAEDPQLLDLVTVKQLELTPQQNLEWSPKETLDPLMRQRLEPAIQQTLMGTQSAGNLRAGVETPAPTCTTGGRCEPKIVMLPIFTIQNAPQQISRTNRRGYYHRSANTSSVDDNSFSDENYDELPQNASIRSKVLETVNKLRQKQADIFSDENAQHGEPIERSQITVGITRRSVEDMTSTTEPSQPTTTKRSHNDAKKSVMNLLELLEEHEKIEDPTQNEAEPNPQITNKNPPENPNEKAKKRVMRLLDLLEEKGGKAQLNSREIVEFDAKMRKIYTSVLSTTRKGDFMKMWDLIS